MSNAPKETTVPDVIKYPRTEHLFDTGGTAVTSDDLVISEADVAGMFADGRPVFVEEKIDGANLGIRYCKSHNDILVQNRSHYISTAEHAQFSMITPWVEQHRTALMEILFHDENLILYGEWCTARHSILYDKLPGYFVAFDLYNTRENRFYSRRRFHTVLEGSGIPVVPTIGVLSLANLPSNKQRGKQRESKNKQKKGTNNNNDHHSAIVNTVKSLLDTCSKFRKNGGTVEGVILRVDNQEWMMRKFKVVRPDFVGGCSGGHWNRRSIEKQAIDYAFALSYLEECYVFSENQEVDEEAEQINGTTESSSRKQPASSKQTKPKKSKRQEVINSDEQKMFKSRRRKVPRCIMLMGLPASGKSTFAARLENGLNEDNLSKMVTVVANQDALGHKECLAVAGRAASSKKQRVILDRCNLTENERKEWLKCMHSPLPSDVSLVYFAAPSKTCAKRANLRLHHATVRPGKASSRVVEQQADRLEAPTERERRDVFGTIHVVRTWQDADSLLLRWGVET